VRFAIISAVTARSPTFFEEEIRYSCANAAFVGGSWPTTEQLVRARTAVTAIIDFSWRRCLLGG